MSHQRLDLLQHRARAGGYAVPHLLGGTSEMVIAHIRAAEDMQSPLALGFAPEVFSTTPLEIALPMMVNAAERALVPVATQLEHGHDFDTVMRAVRLGVSSVMYDGSAQPYEENVTATAEIVRTAHAFGVAVEGELGAVGGAAVKTARPARTRLTQPEQVLDFVKRTGVDSLAVSFGNVHGAYHSRPELDYELVRTISSQVDVPIVMHGGSGLTPEQYLSCIDAGISNVHFYSAIARGLWDHLRNEAQAKHHSPAYHELVQYTQEYFYENAFRVMEMLGSVGKEPPPGDS